MDLLVHRIEGSFMNRSFRGYFAEKILEKEKQDDSIRGNACGAYIAEMDYFEKQRTSILKEFQLQDVADDIYVLINRENLM